MKMLSGHDRLGRQSQDPRASRLAEVWHWLGCVPDGRVVEIGSWRQL